MSLVSGSLIKYEHLGFYYRHQTKYFYFHRFISVPQIQSECRQTTRTSVIFLRSFFFFIHFSVAKIIVMESNNSNRSYTRQYKYIHNKYHEDTRRRYNVYDNSLHYLYFVVVVIFAIPLLVWLIYAHKKYRSSLHVYYCYVCIWCCSNMNIYVRMYVYLQDVTSL